MLSLKPKLVLYKKGFTWFSRLTRLLSLTRNTLCTKNCWFDPQPLPSACQSVLRQDNEPQVAVNVDLSEADETINVCDLVNADLCYCKVL